MIINIYDTNNNFIDCINVKKQYEDNFYFQNMPVIGSKRCKDILNKLYPHFKADGVTFIFEDVATGRRGLQKIYRNGTIVNF